MEHKLFLSEIVFRIGKPKYGSQQFTFGFEVHPAEVMLKMNSKTIN